MSSESDRTRGSDVRKHVRTPVVVLALTVVAVAGLAGFGYAAPSQTAAAAQYAPENTSPPTISGNAVDGETLTATTGSWSGTTPINYSFQWQRCDASGLNCSNIAGASSQSYKLVAADVGRTIRVLVTAQNASGSNSAPSAPTAAVRAGGPQGAVRLPSGETSVPVASVSLPERLIVAAVGFSPNPVRSRRNAITVRVKVTDTRGFVVRDALVFVRSTPLVTTAPPEARTGQDGWVTFKTFPRSRPGLIFPLRNGLNVQFYVQARKLGERVIAGVTATRLVQVRTASPR